MNDGDDLVRLLCTRAGMIVNDAFPIALAIRVDRPAGSAGVVSDLRNRVGHISALLQAAGAVAVKY